MDDCHYDRLITTLKIKSTYSCMDVCEYRVTKENPFLVVFGIGLEL
jgi:hypothetical protein